MLPGIRSSITGSSEKPSSATSPAQLRVSPGSTSPSIHHEMAKQYGPRILSFEEYPLSLEAVVASSRTTYSYQLKQWPIFKT